MKRLLKSLLLVLPLALYFSYWPVISLGTNESMNFELSVPLIWLVIFDAVGLVMMICEGVLFSKLKERWWLWLLFPVWLTLTVMWSLNTVRGVLTVGILWLIYFAGYVMWVMRDWWDVRFRKVWWRWFFGSAVFVCGWCAVQCILDLVGVSQDYSLMCDGCTYHMFGFPHPNGFAIEPQFMGNLLLAPGIASVYLILSGGWDSVLRGRDTRARLHGARALIFGSGLRKLLKTLSPAALVLLFVAVLFLTFSRGAIYAFVVGVMVMSVVMIVRERKSRGIMWKRVGVVWGLVILSFVVVLNVQGLMAEVGPTDDTYQDGVAKVVNHLSLGVIDLKDNGEAEDDKGDDDRGEVVEKTVENSEDNVVENSVKEEAVFEGYVAESTDTRLRLTGAALSVWGQSAQNALFGVGLGGAGVALYNNGLSPAPKEIVQNEYSSLLLETGLVGVSLLGLTAVLVVRVIWKKPMKVILIGLLAAYGVSLFFFSGLPNALHIYLLPLSICAVQREREFDS